jgi:hypothetical protein
MLIDESVKKAPWFEVPGFWSLFVQFVDVQALCKLRALL